MKEEPPQEDREDREPPSVSGGSATPARQPSLDPLCGLESVPLLYSSSGMIYKCRIHNEIFIITRLEMDPPCRATIAGTPLMAVAGFSEGKLNIIVLSARLIFA